MTTLLDLGLPDKVVRETLTFVDTLKQSLKQNLHCVVIYGSAVRGGFDPGSSDINLLIVLEASTPEAHTVIGENMRRSDVEIDPFVLTRPGIERSFKSFAIKFNSIKRHYVLLHGEDVLAGFTADRETARFLCEQAVRNLRLRNVQAYIHWSNDQRRYQSYLQHAWPVILTDLSEILRLDGAEVPNDFDARLPQLSDAFHVHANSLTKLHSLVNEPRPINSEELLQMHRFLHGLLDAAVEHISAL